MLARGLSALAVCGLVLAGCAVTPETAFPEARTAAECEAQYAQAQQRTRQARSNTSVNGGGLVGAIAVGIASGAVESNDRTKYLVCLQRVGATEADFRSAVGGASLPTRPMRQSAPVAPQLPAAGCGIGSSVMVGGTGYCPQ